MKIPLALFVGIVTSSIIETSWSQIRSELVGSGFTAPVYLTAAPGDGNRLFVVEQGGAIRILDKTTGQTNATAFLQVPDVYFSGESGLLGLAFHPNYAVNGKFYVNVIDNATRDTQIWEYTASSNPNVADVNSGRLVLTVDQPDGQTNHKAGWMGFGGDGNLYIATGDGGGGNDPNNFAQNTNSLLGKMLRITVNPSAPTGGPYYTIPAGNPFASGGGAAEVWAYGLRNPFRNSFDRETGDLWIADVGQGVREEVNFQAAGSAGGENYGWRPLEGSGDNPGSTDPAPGNAVGPVYDYGRGADTFQGETVIGGYVYRGSLIPELQGKYIFGDFVDGKAWAFTLNGDGEVTDLISLTGDLGAAALSGLASFGEDADGELYFVSVVDGEVYQIVPEPSSVMLVAGGLGVLALALRRRRA